MCAPCDAARAAGHDAAQHAGQYAAQSAGFAPRQERAHVQPGGAPSTDEDMMPCPHCARTFFPDRLAKHVLVCGKAAQKKKALEEFIAAEDEHDAAPPPVPKGCESGQLAKYHKWRDASQNLKVVLEYNRQIARAKKQGVDLATLPPPPVNVVDRRVVSRTITEPSPDPNPSPNPDPTPSSSRVPNPRPNPDQACPHCARKFDALVAERHIPQCLLRFKQKPKAGGRAGGRGKGAGGRGQGGGGRGGTAAAPPPPQSPPPEAGQAAARGQA